MQYQNYNEALTERTGRGSVTMYFSTWASFAVAVSAVVIFALAVWRIEHAIRAENVSPDRKG